LPLPGLELQPLGRPARIQSLNRLFYHYGYIIMLTVIVLIYNFVFTHSI
jgi:hypothetical protein